MGLAAGAVGVTERLAPFLPAPTVERDPMTGRLFLDLDRPQSIGTVRAFMGNPQTVLKAYAWVMSLGAAGLRAVAETAVLNNNYLATKVAGIRGAGVSFAGANDQPRLEQIRYSWERMTEETGVGTEDVERRMVDFGLQSYFDSHHPWVVPEPFTLEPTETFSKEDLDEYVAVLQRISDQAYADPETVKSAPHRASIGRIPAHAYEDPVTTWRAFRARGADGPAQERRQP
jgi:glycine dehydrogenase subunit 2